MPFKTELKLTSIRGTKLRRLDAPLCYYSARLGIDIIVPSGFITDFATIPRAVRAFIDNDSGVIRDAAVVHDYLYSNESPNYHPEINKLDADLILNEGMHDLGASWLKRTVVYYVVSLFGGDYYRKGHQNKNIKK